MSTLHVLKYGQEGRGPIVALLHGWASSSKIWQPCIPFLSEDSQIWCVDLPGHGKNHAVEWDGSVDQALALLAEVLPEQCIVIGWSLGGLLAQLFAHHYPQRVQKLMLIASTPKFVDSQDWLHGMPVKTFTKFVKQFDESPETTIKQFNALQTLHGQSSKQILYALQQAATDNHSKQVGKIRWGLNWLQEIDLRNEQFAESFPVFLFQGENDQVTSIKAVEDMLEIWEQLNLHKVPNAAHLPFISHQDQFIEQFKTMLAAPDKNIT